MQTVNKKNNILIIDDSEVNIQILSRILCQEYEVITANNGQEGLKLAKLHAPDVIILDIVMPKMDGYETITALKNSDQTKRIPVVFVTGLTNADDEGKALALGCADYITKPFCEEVVRLRIDNQISILNQMSTIEYLCSIDQLTGIPNRRSLDERLYTEWKRAARDQTQFSVLLVDIDDFKICNDIYGHLQGDVVLQTVAEIIATTVRRPADFAARWGGEEFIVLLPKTTSDGAMAVAEKIRTDIEKKTIEFKDGQSTNVTVSVGVTSHIPTNKCSVLSFLHCADSALYQAKEDGRNLVRYLPHPDSEALL